MSSINELSNIKKQIFNPMTLEGLYSFLNKPNKNIKKVSKTDTVTSTNDTVTSTNDTVTSTSIDSTTVVESKISEHDMRKKIIQHLKDNNNNLTSSIMKTKIRPESGWSYRDINELYLLILKERTSKTENKNDDGKNKKSLRKQFLKKNGYTEELLQTLKTVDKDEYDKLILELNTYIQKIQTPIQSQPSLTIEVDPDPESDSNSESDHEIIEEKKIEIIPEPNLVDLGRPDDWEEQSPKKNKSPSAVVVKEIITKNDFDVTSIISSLEIEYHRHKIIHTTKGMPDGRVYHTFKTEINKDQEEIVKEIITMTEHLDNFKKIIVELRNNNAHKKIVHTFKPSWDGRVHHTFTAIPINGTVVKTLMLNSSTIDKQSYEKIIHDLIAENPGGKIEHLCFSQHPSIYTHEFYLLH